MLNKNLSAVPGFAQAHHRHAIIALSIFSIVAGLMTAYFFVSQMLSEQGAALVDLVGRKNKEEAQVKYLRSLKDALRETETERARLGTYFMNERSVAGFLGRVEQMGRGLGLETQTVSLGVEKNVLKINVQTQGAFGQIDHFVSLLEKLPYKLRVDAADIRRVSDTLWSGDFRVSVVSFTPPIAQ